MEATDGRYGHSQVCGHSWSWNLASQVGERAPTTWEPRGEWPGGLRSPTA